MTTRVRHKLSASVFIALLRGRDVLLLRRTGTGWLDGCLSVPAGGLDASETIAAAAIREAHEEIGVRIASENLTYAHTLHSLTDGSDWVGHFFRVTQWTGAPSLRERDKHSDLAWWPLSDLPPATIPYVRQALICIDQGRPYSEFGWPLAPPRDHLSGV
jgi:8-oxo-dGTP pyrophosphatase MutT (NUDIX family)